MYVVQQEVNFEGKTHKVGDLISTPTSRMIDLGIVIPASSAQVVEDVQAVEAEPVVELLTEVSEPVDVQVEQEDEQEDENIEPSTSWLGIKKG
jgi:hypothetical protein